MQIGYYLARHVAALGREAHARSTDQGVDRRAGVAHARQTRRAAPGQRGRLRARHRSPHRSISAATPRSTTSSSRRCPGEVIGLIGTTARASRRCRTRSVATSRRRAACSSSAATSAASSAHQRAALGLGRTFQAATLFPELTVRETVQLALEARESHVVLGIALLWLPSITTRATPSTRSRRSSSTSSGSAATPTASSPSSRPAPAASSSSRTVLAVAPRVICLDEPTAGVAQREAEAFGPLINRVQAGARRHARRRRARPAADPVDQRPHLLPRSGRRSSPRVRPTTVRNDPRVVASYLGTDDRAIQRSNAGS